MSLSFLMEINMVGTVVIVAGILALIFSVVMFLKSALKMVVAGVVILIIIGAAIYQSGIIGDEKIESVKNRVKNSVENSAKDASNAVGNAVKSAQ